MQSPLRLSVTAHIAAVMDAATLAHLPELVEGCGELGVETLTVCTLPPDLRLASAREGVALTDALERVEPQLRNCSTTLLGRRFYLPESLSAAFMPQPFADIDLRIAIDYACRPSMLCGDAELPAVTALLLPRGLEPGNLLRWQFARARSIEVDWQDFDASALAGLLERRIALPRLIAAR